MRLVQTAGQHGTIFIAVNGPCLDAIRLDAVDAYLDPLAAQGRAIDMLVDEAELERRRAAWTPPKPKFERGYGWMFAQHIRQADEGCDFDFLETQFGAPTGEPDIF